MQIYRSTVICLNEMQLYCHCMLQYNENIYDFFNTLYVRFGAIATYLQY